MMSGTITKRGNSYGAKLTIAGTQLWIGTFAEHDHARAAIDRTVLSPHPTLTLDDLAEFWGKRPGVKSGTHEHNLQMIGPFLKRHGSRPAASFIRLEAVKWTQDNFPSARFLKALFGYGLEIGVLPDNPFDGLRVTKKKKAKVAPSDEQIAAALTAAETVYADDRAEFVKDLIQTARGTGLRLTELAELSPESVYRVEGRMRLLVVGKGDVDRVVPVPRSVVPIIERRMDGKLLFEYRGRQLTRQRLHKLMAPVREEAGLPDMNWHLLRYKFASDAVDAGVQDRDLALSLWGHHDTRLLVDVYSHPNREAALRRMEVALDPK
jgi:site-specific recombinase XerD